MQFQIGKFGLTEGVIESLKLAFKNHRSIRISALKASGRNKETIKQIADSIKAKIGFPCEYKIIGFTIAFKKTKV